MSDQVEQLAVVSHHQGGQAAAEPEGVARDGVEHRLGVAGRGRDEAQDLGGGGLLLAAGLDLHGRSAEATSHGGLRVPRRRRTSGLTGERPAQPRILRGELSLRRFPTLGSDGLLSRRHSLLHSVPQPGHSDPVRRRWRASFGPRPGGQWPMMT